ncbi:MAG: hypothetical protein WCF17_11400 [Terracidiphilus sp.]
MFLLVILWKSCDGADFLMPRLILDAGKQFPGLRFEDGSGVVLAGEAHHGLIESK